MPEETVGFINVMLKNITDWELNAKQVYGIENAIMALTRTDGYSAVVTHCRFFRALDMCTMSMI